MDQFQSLLSAVLGIECSTALNGQVSSLRARLLSGLSTLGVLTTSTSLQTSGLVTTTLFSVDNTTVHIPVTELTFALLANSTYLCRYFINFDGVAAGNFRFAVAAPALTAGYYGGIRESSAAANTVIQTVEAFGGADLFTRTSGVGAFKVLEALAFAKTGVNAGNLVFSFAQAAANLGATNVNINSLAILTKLA